MRRPETNTKIGNLMRFAYIALTAIWLSACAGGTLISPEDEARIGAEQHPKIIAEYGGVYDNEAVRVYVNQVMARLVKASDKPDAKYVITVLDTPVVNAFALPGGYTYVTRGLLALANSEAELAGVIGHEIAHVTARHGARRHTAAVGTQVLAGVLGAVLAAGTGVNRQVSSDLVNLGGAAILAGYSRENEYEADNLGIQAMARAGYAPQAQGDFLASLGAYAAYESGGKAARSSWFATHPNNKERVEKAREKAAAQPQPARPRIGKKAHLAAIDGMLYGDGVKQGIVRGRRFEHADLRLRFDVPPGFKLKNTPQRVEARHANKVQIIFDLDERIGNEPLADYIRTGWAAGANVTELQNLKINGRKAASARVATKGGIALLLAIDNGVARIMRFGVIAPSSQIAAAEGAMASLKRQIDFLSAGQAAAIKPLRMRVVRVNAGDTVSALAKKMSVSGDKVALFQVLNGMQEADILRTGQLVKLVTQ